MQLTEQQYIILFSLIKFYTRPQDEMLRKRYGDKLYFETYKYFNENLEVFVNKKIALDRIYTSLCNASQTYIIFRQMASNGTIGMFEEVNEHKIFLSFNESFISALIINFSKLKEVLTFKKNLVFKDDSLRDSFFYLDDLNTKITKSDVTGLRNGWFAHAFEDERKGIVYRDKDIKESIFNTLENICAERHRDDFNKSTDRLVFFCENYLFEAYTSFKLERLIKDIVNKANKSDADILTKPKEIINELNYFSRKIMDIKLFGIESFFIVEDYEIRKWSGNPKEYFKKNLDLLK